MRRGEPAGIGIDQNRDCPGPECPISSSEPSFETSIANGFSSGISTGDVSPPFTDTCTTLVPPGEYSEMYSRLPSLTNPNFGNPSFVICFDPRILGAGTGASRK